MHCCLNPSCPNPHNPDGIKFCQSCGNPLVVLRNHYHPRQLLSNEGGFGRTYLAEDIDKLHEKCVIKQLAPQVQGTSALQKAKELFEQEARQLQQLGEHPQIPTLYAYFEQDGYLYLVQQYIEGQPLHKCQPGTWKETQVRELLEQLLPVLEFIHQRGVIHRDIKPPNIMRRKSDGKYVLIDFGASKQLKSTVVAGQGTQIGTNGYSPFEQMKRGEAYPASDLYSLGVTCFYLLTGKDPFALFLDEGYGWVDSWRKHLLQPMSEQLQQVFDQLLQKESQNRYQQAGDLLRDLQKKLKPIQQTISQPKPQVQPQFQPQQHQSKPQPRPVLPILAAILLLGGVGVVVGLVLTLKTLENLESSNQEYPNPTETETDLLTIPDITERATIEAGQYLQLRRSITAQAPEEGELILLRQQGAAIPGNKLGFIPSGSVLLVMGKQPAVSDSDAWVQIQVCSTPEPVESEEATPTPVVGAEGVSEPVSEDTPAPAAPPLVRVRPSNMGWISEQILLPQVLPNVVPSATEQGGCIDEPNPQPFSVP
ncbi:serine/threonine-protein kinase [Oscillatoria acuminata]|uniref:non-specific serine/threonine protein kinase n=1 Tax=Oscillatoria acuminata PCC 6304 TaxID=56110 RepID=K9TQH7_9CYAN|nr:serine/threonine-protein kinase [Oscillatoria acuminata]AFY84785.1 serine/threonine protein kinase [Oscillatoria acuminata PCC 6304]